MRGHIVNRIIAPNQTLTEIISVDQLKTTLGVSDPYDSQSCILSHSGVSARSRLEVYLSRSVTPKNYIQTDILSDSRHIDLLPYLQSVSSVKVYDEEGTETELESDDYIVLTGDTATVILPDAYYKTVITFSAGYSDVQPEWEICREAVIMMVQNMYVHKADILTPEVKSMVAPLKRQHI